MKITFISCFFPPRIGGVEKYTDQLCQQISKTEDIYVLTSEKNITPKKHSYPVHHLPYKKFLNYKTPCPKSLTTHIKKTSPDIIHLNGPLPYATFSAIIIKKLFLFSSQKPKLILTYHGHPNPKSILKKFLVVLERQFYRFLFDQIIVTSKKYAKSIKRFYPKRKITVIPLAIESQFFKTPNQLASQKKLNLSPKQKHIAFIGTIDENHYYKGFKTITETAQLLPDINFLIIGKTNLSNDQTETLPQNLNLIGPVSTKLLPHYLFASDILILPSNSSSEGFGIVLLESAATGTPVITTSVVGSSNFIKKTQSGLIIEPNSPKALKTAIQKLLTSPLLYKHLSTNAQKATKDLTWKNTAKKTLQLYNSLSNP